MKASFEQLIEKGILVRADESETLSNDGYISYHPGDDFKLFIPLDGQTYNVYYVQKVLTEHNTELWVAQLEGRPNDPVNASLNIVLNFDVYRKI